MQLVRAYSHLRVIALVFGVDEGHGNADIGAESNSAGVGVAQTMR